MSQATASAISWGGLRQQRLAHVGLDHPRRDGVDPDPLGAGFVREALGEALDRPLEAA
jgi:hypothetical protein